MNFAANFLKEKVFFAGIRVEFLVIRELTFHMKVYSRMITNFFSKLFTALKRLQTVSCSKPNGSEYKCSFQPLENADRRRDLNIRSNESKY